MRTIPVPLPAVRLPGGRPVGKGMPALRSLSAALAMALAASAAAQPPAPEDTGQDAAEPAPGATSGWRVSPTLLLGLGYDSNLFATPGRPDDDAFLAFTPSLRLDRDWNRASARIDASLTQTRYLQAGREDSLDYRLGASGDFRYSGTTRFFGGLSLARKHEDRTSPDDVFGVEPTIYREGNAHFGLARRSGKWSLRTGGTVQALAFRDVRDEAGLLINNADRDRAVYGLGLRVGRALRPDLDLFVQATLDERRYRGEADDAGFDRDSTGHGLVFGLAKRGAGRLEGEAYVGWIGQRYQDPALEDVSVPTAGMRLSWQRPSGLQLSAALERAIYETTIPGASAYLDTSLDLRASRWFDDRFFAHAGLVLAYSEFQGIDRADQVLVPSVGVAYRLSRRFRLEADYRLLQRRSDLADAEYDRHSLLLGLRFDPGGAPLARKDDSAPVPGPGGPGGAYAGAALGHEVLNTRVTGSRGEHGDYLGEFSGDGGTAMAYLGWGHSFGRLYVAAELDTVGTDSGWRHDKVPDSRYFAAASGRAEGATAWLGYVLAGQGVASLGIGRRQAAFDSAYVTDEGVATNHDDRAWATTQSLALEVPLTGHLFARARYEVAPYAGYEVTYEDPASDRFSGSQGRFEIGLGWRFRQQAVLVEQDRWPGGFYAGLQAGDDRGWSSTDAVMRQSGAPQETFFQADFGGRGLDLGAFAGYGRHWGAFYAGIELEADASDSLWEHLRLPQGRQFSVEARSSDGASLRLGYATRGGALLYLRGGVVRGRFVTLYQKGQDPDAWIDRDDTLSGTRIGLGIEAPISRRLFIRLDYTSTTYESVGFTTTHQRADELSFRNRQHLARLGLGVRF